MKSTYEQLKKIVLPNLEAYQSDLLEHDKNILDEYDGKFLYGFRKYGTDLLKYLPDFESYKKQFNNFKDRQYSDNDIEKCLQEEIIWITYPDRNTTFLYFDGIKLKSITQERANNLHREFISNIIYTYKMKNTVISF